MSKRSYRATPVKTLEIERLLKEVAGGELVVSLDIAKRVQFAAVFVDSKPVRLMKWDQLQREEQARAMSVLRRLAAANTGAALVMEPSGTYGDPLRHAAREVGFAIYKASPKRCHDYAEVFDGVPSHHDGKSAMIVGQLHLNGLSQPWPSASERHRILRALRQEAELHQDSITRHLGHLEAWAARHWPELHQILPLDRASVLDLLAHYGAPASVAADRSSAASRMRRRGGHSLAMEKIQGVLDSAGQTMGVPTHPAESAYLQALAREILHHRLELSDVRRRIKEQSAKEPAVVGMSSVLGLVTSAVVFVEIGDPRHFPSAKAFVKAAGLNLREKSSGQSRGLLRLSKRGSSRGRKYLYLAALRLVQRDAVVSAWYFKKVRRDGGRVRKKAVIAVMRKLAASLWHLARGEDFDAHKLFDSSRLTPRYA